jgi:hypothetical protein
MQEEKYNINILKIIGAFFFMIIVLLFIIWCYYYDGRLFVSMISLLYLIYAFVNIIFISKNKDTMTIDTHNILFGIAIYMTIISLGIFVLFIMKFYDVV